MRYGPLIFLAAFFALASSWVTFVLAPQLQVGQLQQTNAVGQAVSYPIARPGLARAGAEVYRANGCQYCHTRQVGQTGTEFEVTLTEAGTNQAAVLEALLQVTGGPKESAARQSLSGLPKVVRREPAKEAADAVAKALNAAGAKTQVGVQPTGPDIARGWGKRRTVAEDYLFDYPVMLGSRRVGPDLANVGLRLSDLNWHLRHLYAPQGEVNGSTMPSYRFLFQTRRAGQTNSPDALVFAANTPAKLLPPSGYEVVPTPEAKALAAYLVSLRADAPLFDAPFSVAAAAAPASTNAPAPAGGTTTNAPATNAPAK
jgi:cbb3-type cytochrome oxidase cytochrome c subunit